MDEDPRALRDACERGLPGHGIQRADDLLATIPPGTAVDRYGDGGVVADLRSRRQRLGVSSRTVPASARSRAAPSR